MNNMWKLTWLNYMFALIFTFTLMQDNWWKFISYVPSFLSLMFALSEDSD